MTEIVAWKLIAYDEDNNEIILNDDIDNWLAQEIDDYMTEIEVVGKCEVCDMILLEGDEEMKVHNFQNTYNAVFCGQMHFEEFIKKWNANARDD